MSEECALAPSYDVIVLSPHLDDGVLSCGAHVHQIAQGGGRALIATIFTADVVTSEDGGKLTPFAERVLHYMNLDPSTAMVERRREDAAACRLLGADWVHLDLEEAIYRHPDGAHSTPPYASAAALFAEPDPTDAQTLAEPLKAVLDALPSAKTWLAPLGIGGHVDHRMVRLAAKAQHPATSLEVQPQLAYYEDAPYAYKFKNRLRTLGLPLFRQLKAEALAASPHDLNQKIQAIAAYTSQIKPLFGGQRQLERAVRWYSRKVGGERIWRSS